MLRSFRTLSPDSRSESVLLSQIKKNKYVPGESQSDYLIQSPTQPSQEQISQYKSSDKLKYFLSGSKVPKRPKMPLKKHYLSTTDHTTEDYSIEKLKTPGLNTSKVTSLRIDDRSKNSSPLANLSNMKSTQSLQSLQSPKSPHSSGFIPGSWDMKAVSGKKLGPLKIKKRSNIVPPQGTYNIEISEAYLKKKSPVLISFQRQAKYKPLQNPSISQSQVNLPTIKKFNAKKESKHQDDQEYNLTKEMRAFIAEEISPKQMKLLKGDPTSKIVQDKSHFKKLLPTQNNAEDNQISKDMKDLTSQLNDIRIKVNTMKSKINQFRSIP